MALLRMKLHTVDIFRSNGAPERNSVFRRRKHIVVRGAVEIIRVQKVEAGVLLEPAEQSGAAFRDHVVPSHVRQTRRLTQRLLVKAPDAPVDPAQSRELALLAGAGEDLHPDANP